MFYIVYYDMAGKQIPHNIIPRDVKETELDYYNWPKSFVPIEEIADPTDHSREKFGKSKKEKKINYKDIPDETTWVALAQKELITVFWDGVSHTISEEEFPGYHITSYHKRPRILSKKQNSSDDIDISQQLHSIITIPLKDIHAMNEKYKRKKKNIIAKNSKRLNSKTKSYRPRQVQPSITH